MAKSSQDVIEQMAEWGISGLTASDLVADGKYHRFKPDGGKGTKKSAWYILWEHQTTPRQPGALPRTVLVGAFGKGPDTFKVKPSDSDWSIEERAEFAAAQKLREKEAAKLRKAESEAAATKADRLWNIAHEGGVSPYLTRKQVKPFGVRFLRDTLLVPVRGVDGVLRGCQHIGADGSKRFNTGMEKAGGFCVLGEIVPGGRVLFAEGYVTGASLHMATGYAVVVCFDAGNLDRVAAELRPLYPDATFIFCGDDDRHLRRRLRERLVDLGLPGDLEPDGTLHVFHLAKPGGQEGETQELRIIARFDKRDGAQAIKYSIQRDDGDPREYWLENAGRKHAEACAKRFKGVAVFPAFAADAAAGTDFNDVHLAEGLGVVRSQVLAGLQEAQAGKKAPLPDEPPGGAPDDADGKPHWSRFFRLNDRGRVEGSLYNTLLVLDNDEDWRGLIVFDEFAQRIMKVRESPAGAPGEWSDADDVLLMVDMSKAYRFEPKKPTVMDAVMHVGHANRVHPVREYLGRVAPEWDGVARVRYALSKYWGALSTADTASLDEGEKYRLGVYLQLVAVKWFVGAVARVRQPGCKLDTMVVMEGGQGAKKSSSLRALFGEFFADSKLVLGDKDATAQMQGVWGYEMGELDAFSKAEDTLFKQFMSTQSDRWRPPYGKRAVDVPRQGIFIGTTNQRQYGKDPTGMRRVWPVLTGDIDVGAIERDRDQLWAEAVHLYEQGARHWVDRDIVVLDPGRAPPGAVDMPWSEWDLFKEQADSRQQEDAWRQPILEYIYTTMSGEDFFSTAQLLGDALKLDRARWSKAEQMRVAAIMQQLGWENKKRGPSYARFNAWIRPELQGQATPRSEEGGDEPIPF